MKAIVFDVRGTVAHFRRPDTTATQLSYPFITPTAAKGLVGAILGITDFVTKDKVGIQLLNPIRTSAQQLSMLGKDSGSTFNRPTSVELLVNPAYRIYYVGSEHVETLAEKLKNRHSVYPTYLGVAYALTYPQLVSYYCEIYVNKKDSIIETNAVVPTDYIEELLLEDDRYYRRAGGFMKDYLGERSFEKSLSFLYERDGRSIRFCKKDHIEVAEIGGEKVCLV